MYAQGWKENQQAYCPACGYKGRVMDSKKCPDCGGDLYEQADTE